MTSEQAKQIRVEFHGRLVKDLEGLLDKFPNSDIIRRQVEEERKYLAKIQEEGTNVPSGAPDAPHQSEPE